MKATTLFKPCLLACSVLAGAQALADPAYVGQAPGTVNSIEFSFMHYSSPPLPVFSLPLTGLDTTGATPPAFVPTPQALLPAIEAALPSLPGRDAPQQSSETAAEQALAAVPEPGSAALLGLGLALACLLRRERRHD